jgi:hypothetical protein
LHQLECTAIDMHRESRSQNTSQRSHEQAEDRASDDEANAQFLCDSLHGYHPPPMPH